MDRVWIEYVIFKSRIDRRAVMIMVMIRRITIGEKQKQNCTVDIDEMYNKERVFARFFGYSTRYLRAVAIFLLIYPCLIGHIEKKKKKEKISYLRY